MKRGDIADIDRDTTSLRPVDNSSIFVVSPFVQSVKAIV